MKGCICSSESLWIIEAGTGYSIHAIDNFVHYERQLSMNTQTSSRWEVGTRLHFSILTAQSRQRSLTVSIGKSTVIAS
jgi:hypothetical protein